LTIRQNNGVIAITRCANRTAGRWCCAFLIVFGVLGKVSGVFLASERSSRVRVCVEIDVHPTVPNPVLGGVTTFLFASVVTSGVRVLGYVRFTRRDRFILAAALSFGLGDILAPTVFTHLFDGVKTTNKGVQGLMSSVTIVLSTPCECAAVVDRMEG
jgi:xanthine/uracil permease